LCRADQGEHPKHSDQGRCKEGGLKQFAADATSKKFAQHHCDHDQADECSHEEKERDVELGPDLPDIGIVLRQIWRGRRDADAYDGDQYAGHDQESAVSPGKQPAATCPIPVHFHSACNTSTTLVRAAHLPGIKAATMATATPSTSTTNSSSALNVE